ncbi:MAG: hypothetical protein FWF11_01150 [Coriobacteriia bacterium]|nr:hypothetical protein [Coriobacteriia bacterium]
MAAMLAFALLAVLLVLVAITLVMVINRPKDTIRVVEASETKSKEKPEVLLERRVGENKDPLRTYMTAASFAIILALMWLSTGAVTRVNLVCTSCHGSDLHVEQLAYTPHRDISCVSCHETGGFIGSVTTAMPARVAHIVVGTFVDENVPGYRSFSESSCYSCHAGRLSGVRLSSNGLMRISHLGIIEARFPCAQCHVLDSDKGTMTIARGAMQRCVTCHDATANVPLVCSTCHRNNSQYVSARQLDPDADFSRQLVPHSVFRNQEFCYRCHETAGCDACHGGIRMPHPTQYVYSTHVTDTWDYGIAACDTCHTRKFCDNCHGFEMRLTPTENPMGSRGRP